MPGLSHVTLDHRRVEHAVASDRPAELVALPEGGDYAAAGQRNQIAGEDGREVPFTAITLVTARDGLVAALAVLRVRGHHRRVLVTQVT